MIELDVVSASIRVGRGSTVVGPLTVGASSTSLAESSRPGELPMRSSPQRGLSGASQICPFRLRRIQGDDVLIGTHGRHAAPPLQ